MGGSGRGTDDRAVERRRYLLVLALGTLLHVALAVSLPLSGDEVYYWDCSRHAEWSSFDQPKLVIWGIGAARQLFGDTRLAVRFPSLVSSLAIGVVLLPLMRRLGGGLREATLGYALLHAVPVFYALAFYSCTDTTMWALYLAALWAAVAIAQGEERAWWGFGLAIGLGFLAKFPAVLAVGAIGGALSSVEARSHLRRPAPWLAALLAFALTTPVWIWAVQHDWDNILFQLAGRHGESGFGIEYLAAYLGGVLGLGSPPLVVAFALAWVVAWRTGDPAWRALAGGAAATFFVFLLVALRSESNAHWAGPTLVASVVPAVLLDYRWKRGLLKSGIVVGVVVALLATGLALGRSALLEIDRLPKKEIVKMFGNDEIAAEVERRLAAGELAATERYSAVHDVAFRTGGRVPTRLALLRGGSHGLASLYWYSPDELRDRDVLLFTERDGMGELLAPRCASIEELEPWSYVRDGVELRRYRFYRCRDLLHPEDVFTRLP
jgi:4-amino-4-deoxy-L-arabinose transferase-like glycosyltransferase